MQNAKPVGPVDISPADNVSNTSLQQENVQGSVTTSECSTPRLLGNDTSKHSSNSGPPKTLVANNENSPDNNLRLVENGFNKINQDVPISVNTNNLVIQTVSNFPTNIGDINPPFVNRPLNIDSVLRSGANSDKQPSPFQGTSLGGVQIPVLPGGNGAHGEPRTINRQMEDVTVLRRKTVVTTIVFFVSLIVCLLFYYVFSDMQHIRNNTTSQLLLGTREPWVCMIRHKHVGFICGCTMIKDDWSVTLSSCLESFVTSRDGLQPTLDVSSLIVKLNRTDRSIRRLVDRVVTPVNASFMKDVCRDGGDNCKAMLRPDIALLRIIEPVLFESNYPVRLATRHLANGNGESAGCNAISFEADGSLKEISLDILEKKYCRVEFSLLYLGKLCGAFTLENRPFCVKGVGGGSILCSVDDDHYTMIGIAPSMVIGCDSSTIFFTDIADHFVWINDVVHHDNYDDDWVFESQ